MNNPINKFDFYGLETCGHGPFGEPAVPDNPLGFPFSPCCVAHDECYGTCKASKSSCDSNFWRCMRGKCQRYAGIVYVACTDLADTYTAAVHNLGQKAYDDAQKAACVGKDCEDDNPLNLPEYQE